jgi:hypothetical protein
VQRFHCLREFKLRIDRSFRFDAQTLNLKHLQPTARLLQRCSQFLQ